jgi:hypothetical protein
MGRERGREVRRGHHEMPIKGRSRIEATKEATDAVTETKKNVREEAQESNPKVSRTGCESSRVPEGNIGCNKR